MNLVLASGSPRRRQLLREAGYEFEVVPSSAEETFDERLGVAGLCEENARLKAEEVSQRMPGALVLGADTLVFIDGSPLGKPKDLDEAESMLSRLSGKAHQVCTGICLAGPGDESRAYHQVTEVFFKELTIAQIRDYLSLTNPLDKAGAYGIQDHGDHLVHKIVGDFDNVMGFPMKLVTAKLRENGLPSGSDR